MGEGYLLEQVQCPCPSNGLRAALHAEFTANVGDVLLDGAQAQNEVTSALTIGCPGSEQLQDLVLFPFYFTIASNLLASVCGSDSFRGSDTAGFCQRETSSCLRTVQTRRGSNRTVGVLSIF
jgi:hypothetical protein